MIMLSEAGKSDNFGLHNSLKLGFTNLQGVCSNLVGCESFLESNSWTILALYETSLNNSIDSDSFFVMEDYLHLIQKDSYTSMHGLAVYVKEESVQKVAWDLSLENSANSYFYFWLVLLHLVPYFFFLYQSPSSALCMVYDAMMRFSQSTHLPMYLFLETLTPIIRAS